MKKKKLNKKNIFVLLLFIIFLSTFVFSGLKIINYLKDNKANRSIKNNLDKSIIIKDDDNLPEEEKYIIDFNTLKKQNPDTVAYLRVLNTNINYIVVKGNNNSYYLNHNFDKKKNISGWIYADFNNKFDGTDKNIVIFGHNTKDGSMFGTLKNILVKSWQENEENHKVVLVTENGTDIYQVFSTYTIEPEMYYINTEFNTEEDFIDFKKEILSRTNYDYKVSLDLINNILTLSSCNTSGSKRIVLHATKIINE